MPTYVVYARQMITYVYCVEVDTEEEAIYYPEDYTDSNNEPEITYAERPVVLSITDEDGHKRIKDEWPTYEEYLAASYKRKDGDYDYIQKE